MGPKIIDGGFGVVAMFTIPALRSVIFDDHIENTKYVTSRIITSFVGDLGSCIGAGLLVADGRAVEGIGMKVAYNAFVAVAPDMVRPLKEAVHRFKAKLPFIAVI